MEEKLEKLYRECIEELKSVNINVEDEENVGKINIIISKRNNKRYGCCKQKDPDKLSAYSLKRKIYFRKFKSHQIEISKWVLELNDEKIKNTIIHELIHCFPDCNNHGAKFKEYAEIINEKLGYSISRLGDKKKDYEDSNIEFNEDYKEYKYIIKCEICNQIYYRQRLSKNFNKKYRCGKCIGKLVILN